MSRSHGPADGPAGLARGSGPRAYGARLRSWRCLASGRGLRQDGAVRGTPTGHGHHRPGRDSSVPSGARPAGLFFTYVLNGLHRALPPGSLGDRAGRAHHGATGLRGPAMRERFAERLMAFEASTGMPHDIVVLLAAPFVILGPLALACLPPADRRAPDLERRHRGRQEKWRATTASAQALASARSSRDSAGTPLPH